MWVQLVFLCFIQTINALTSITLYGDVLKNKEFFTKTFPWIIDNIGGSIDVNYHLLGSGRYSVHQMCALRQITRNTFLEAQFLKCEAQGNPSAFCLCDAGINRDDFKECVKSRGDLSAEAFEAFSKLKIGESPLIELNPGNTVFAVPGELYLKKICTIFGDYPPAGCLKPCNTTEEWVDKKPIAQFHENCEQKYLSNRHFYEPTTTPTTSTTSSTKPWIED